MDPERVPGEDDAFGDDARRVGVEKGARGDEVGRCQGRVSTRMSIPTFGDGGGGWAHIELTVCVLRLSQERARLFAKCHGCVDACDGRRTVPQETLKLVHVVGASAASPRVLAVDGIDAQTTGSVAEDQRVLNVMDVGEVSGSGQTGVVPLI